MKVHKEFPRELQKAMLAKNMERSYLLKAMERRGYRITRQFLEQMATGTRKVPIGQLRRIAEVLGLSDSERRLLHIAACRDMGYEV